MRGTSGPGARERIILTKNVGRPKGEVQRPDSDVECSFGDIEWNSESDLSVVEV